MNNLYFAGKCSSDYGIYISGENTFNAPSRDYESIEVPGRNGELLIDNGRYKNITVSYPSFIRTKFSQNAEMARAWLLHQHGYQRLQDTYNPQYFRLAKFEGPLNFDTRFLNLSAECELFFNCKPQRFLVSGETDIILTQNSLLYNSELFDALPLIKVYGNGSGSLTISNITVELNEIDDFIMLDCDTQNAYKDYQIKNSTIHASTFPYLSHGSNEISFTGNITKIEIKPRWWTL